MNKPDIISTLQAEGVTLKQRGANFWACCPFHSEETPSFKVNLERQTFFCFSCHAKGDVITFIQKHRGLSFKDVLAYLNIESGRPSPEALQARAQAQRKREFAASFRLWERRYHSELCLLYRTLQAQKQEARTIKDVEELAPFYHLESTWLARLETLEGKDATEKFELFKECLHG